MADDTNTPRRRKLPVLGMTTVGLAVGAGSLGLYRGAAAVPTSLPPDQPTWTSAETRTPAPLPAEPAPAVPAAPVIPASFEEPAAPPVIPVLPALPQPAAPILPVTPSSADPVLPVAPPLPAVPAPALPELPKPVEIPALLPPPARAVEAEVAPDPRPHSEPIPAPVQPLAVPAQPIQIAPPVRSVPVPLPDFNLPAPAPGFNVNSTPPAVPATTVPGALTSLAPEPPGDTAVITPLQALKSAALGVALAAAPMHAADPPAKIDKAADTTKDDVLSDLKKEVEKLRKDADLEKKFRELTDDTVRGKLNKESGKTEPGLVTKFDELDARMKRIEEALKKVDTTKFEETLARLATKIDDLNKTTTLKPDAKDATPKAMPGPASVTAKATVRIINQYPVAISMMVNGTSYRVEPSGEKSVDVPAGSYTYELLHAGSQPTTATIKENEPVTLRIK